MGRHTDTLAPRERQQAPGASHPDSRGGVAVLTRPAARDVVPPQASRQDPGTPRVFKRGVSRGRMVLGAFAMTACLGIAAVSIADPYAGAVASPYYQVAPTDEKAVVQTFRIDGGYVVVDPKLDKYTVHLAETASTSSSGSASSVISNVVTVPAGTSQAYAASLVTARGWNASQFTCLVELWNRESGWSVTAANPSGAYGIPQALPGSKMGAGWQSSYKVQINWGLSYIAGSYGSPCGAWASSQSRGWY